MAIFNSKMLVYQRVVPTFSGETYFLHASTVTGRVPPAKETLHHEPRRRESCEEPRAELEGEMVSSYWLKYMIQWVNVGYIKCY